MDGKVMASVSVEGLRTGLVGKQVRVRNSQK